MEFKIEKQESKPLVERDEITLKVTKIEATPSNAQIQEAVAKLLNKDKALVVIKKIHQKFGMREVVVTAYAYESEESKKKFEPKEKRKGKEEKGEEKKSEEKEKKKGEKPEEEAK